MNIWIRRLLAWPLAATTTATLASFISSQRVLNALPDPQSSIGMSQRLSTAFYDLHHFATFYGVFILLAFLIAFLSGGLVFRLAKFGRPIVYAVAGAIAMLVMLMGMKNVFFGVDIVAGARDAFGLALQMLAGAAGGYVFAYLTRPLKNIKETQS